VHGVANGPPKYKKCFDSKKDVLLLSTMEICPLNQALVDIFSLFLRQNEISGQLYLRFDSKLATNQ
jgi:hypothetical protein